MQTGVPREPDSSNAERSLGKTHLPDFPTQKIQLILGHLYLLPWFARRSLECELPLRPFLDANPDLQLGGLPIASKFSRYGTEPPYLPSLTICRDTGRSALQSFVDEHTFPFILKPLFGSQSRGVRKVHSVDEITEATGAEPFLLQPYVDAPKEYGINVTRVGSRLKIYGLTEVPVRGVWGDGERRLRAIAEDKYGPEVAAQIEKGEQVPPNGQHVPLQIAAHPGEGSPCRELTDRVTPALRATCERAADQIGLRFGRFDVKAKSLDALQEGHFHVLEANGSPSLDLTLYDDRYPLSVKIERLRAHWDEFFHQAEACKSSDENSWRLLGMLLWFAISPSQCVASFGNEVDDGQLASRT